VLARGIGGDDKHLLFDGGQAASPCHTSDNLLPGPVIRSAHRWLSEEPDPRDLMRPFPAHLMRMWPISTRVNKPENDDPSIIEPIEPATDAA
jgi:hypothetical protein